MQPGRPDYNMINTDEDPIPPDEPVFVLRAQDSLAELVVRFYALMAEQSLHDPRLASAVRAHADLMHTWPTKKRPDLPRDPR